MTDEHRQYQLIRGATLVDSGDDTLHIVLANHTVTFTGAEVTAVARSLVSALGAAGTAEQAVDAAATEGDADAEVCRYVFSLLETNGCLGPPDTAAGEDAGWRFWAAEGMDVVQAQARMLAGPVLVVTVADRAEQVRESMGTAGVNATVHTVGDAGEVPTLASAMGEAALVACWGLGYQTAAALEVARAALTLTMPALFGCAAGRIARIGPCVLPYATACLECVNLRLQAHAGPAETRMVRSLRGMSTVTQAAPTHPSFHRCALDLFCLEAARISLQQPPSTVGGLIELEFGEPATRRRIIHRVPTCPVCHPQRPDPFGWDALVRGPIMAQGQSS